MTSLEKNVTQFTIKEQSTTKLSRGPQLWAMPLTPLEPVTGPAVPGGTVSPGGLQAPDSRRSNQTRQNSSKYSSEQPHSNCEAGLDVLKSLYQEAHIPPHVPEAPHQTRLRVGSAAPDPLWAQRANNLYVPGSLPGHSKGKRRHRTSLFHDLAEHDFQGQVSPAVISASQDDRE